MVTTLEQRWGPGVLVPARQMLPSTQAISTSFPELDKILEPRGIPINAISVLSGASTSGKLTLAYKILSQAQGAERNPRHPVAVFDLSATIDLDYATRCGIELNTLWIVQPQSVQETMTVLLDLIQYREHRAILLDALTDIRSDRAGERSLAAFLPQIKLQLNHSNCALICLDEPRPRFHTSGNSHSGDAVDHAAALHIELEREHWILDDDELQGYQSRARVLRTRSGTAGHSARVAFDYAVS